MVLFQAFVKKVSVKSLVTGDAECEMLLRFQFDKDTFKEITDMYKADQPVMVVLATKEDEEGRNIVRDVTGQDHGRPRFEQPENPADNG